MCKKCRSIDLFKGGTFIKDKESIIVLENQLYLIRFLSNLLVKKYQITICKTFEECENLVGSGQMKVVLIDYFMAQQEDYARLKKLLSLTLDCGVIIIADRTDQLNVKSALKKYPVVLTVDKPAQQYQLLYCIKKAQKLLLEKFPRAGEGAQPPEGASGYTRVQIDISYRLTVSHSLEPLKATARKIGRHFLEVTCVKPLERGTEVIFTLKGEGIPLNVVQKGVTGHKKEPYRLNLASSQSSELFEMFRDEFLDVDHQGQLVQADDPDIFEKARDPEMPPSVAVIDDDATMCKLIHTVLKQAGVERVDTFTSGKEAWDKMQEFQYDFIIQDWIIPDLQGLALINRFRQSKLYSLVPDLVISGIVSKQDFRIIGDFQLTDFVEKPLQGREVVKIVSRLYTESVWYRTQEEKIYRFLENLSGALDPKEVMAFIAKSPNPPKLAMIVGRVLKNNNNLQAAEMVFRIALKNKQTALMAMNELGKIFLKTGRPKEAQKVLEKAMSVSPENVERLCNLGDICLEQMDFVKAGRYFETALEHDAGNAKAQSGQRLIRGLNQYLGQTESIPKNFASLLNACGVSMTRVGKYTEGIEHYKNALKHIDDDILKAKLCFNLGFAFYRWGKPIKAMSWIEKAKKLDPEFEKADKYVAILDHKLTQSGQADPSLRVRVDEELDWDEFTEEEFNTIQAMEIQPQPTTDQIIDEEAQKRQDLTDSCQQIELYFEMLSTFGVYSKSQIPFLHKLLQKHGASQFSKAISLAIRNKFTSVYQIANVIEEDLKYTPSGGQ